MDQEVIWILKNYGEDIEELKSGQDHTNKEVAALRKEVEMLRREIQEKNKKELEPFIM